MFGGEDDIEGDFDEFIVTRKVRTIYFQFIFLKFTQILRF